MGGSQSGHTSGGEKVRPARLRLFALVKSESVHKEKRTALQRLRQAIVVLLPRRRGGRYGLLLTPKEKSILTHPQFRWRLRNSCILRDASAAASSLYSSQ